MSNEQRDELAALLARHEDCAFSASGVLVCVCGTALQPQAVMNDLSNLASHQAAILYAAGYRKARVISTAEELNELESGSVILCTGELTGEGDGDQVLYRTTSFVKPWQNHFVAYFHSDAVFEDFETITVLREGETC